MIPLVYEEHNSKNYRELKESVEQAGLEKPTMTQLVSLVHQALLDDEKPEYLEMITYLRSKGLCSFTGVLHLPGKKTYIQDNLELISDMPYINIPNMEESELIKKLENNDKSVRFVPSDYKFGEISLSELSKNPYVIALVGEESAEKLAEVADKFDKNPYLPEPTDPHYSVINPNQPLATISAFRTNITNQFWEPESLRLTLFELSDFLLSPYVNFGVNFCSLGIQKNNVDITDNHQPNR